MALQALAKYAALTYGSNGDFTVTVTAPKGTAQDFVLDSSNRLVLQRAALPELPGTYGLRARGQGCALVQVGTAWAPRPRPWPLAGLTRCCPPGDPALQRAPPSQHGGV